MTDPICKFLEAPIVSSDEPLVYCRPTPRSYNTVEVLLEEMEAERFGLTLDEYRMVYHVMEA